MFLVAGLGNPGRKYQGTRHNVGFDVVDALLERLGERPLSNTKSNNLYGITDIQGTRCVICKPQLFMNQSGGPIQSLASFYKLTSHQVIVIHDELDLPFQTVRCKQQGGHGGHNGLRDITQRLGREYLRVRVGVGRPPAGWETANYVLGKWSASERAGLDDVISTACDAVETIVVSGIIEAMAQHNIRN